jgi:orotate phosphoribosyltransferase
MIRFLVFCVYPSHASPMPLGVVPEAVSDIAIAYAKQSFKLASISDLLKEDEGLAALYDDVLRGIVSNVKSQPGGFVATSGVVLPYYLNLSTNFMDPRVAPRLVSLVIETLLRAVIPSLDLSLGERVAIVGMEVAGGMLVSQLAAAANTRLLEVCDFIYMRKNRKTTGTAQQLEAMQVFTSRTPTSAKLKAIWVDDCNSTGSSLCEGIVTLQEDYNIDVVQALYIVDRSHDRKDLPNARQKLSDERFVSGATVISAIMDLSEVDVLVPRT